MKQKTRRTIILVIIIGVLTSILLYKTDNYILSNKLTSNVTNFNYNNKNYVILKKNVDLYEGNINNVDLMKKNTINLQNAIDRVSNNGGGTVQLPSGIYYFYEGARNYKEIGKSYVIKPRNNVNLIGAGINENDLNNCTILKPYFNEPTAAGGIDMFYFNNYKDSNFKYKNHSPETKIDITYYDLNNNPHKETNQTLYLINADFSDFIIDGESAKGGIANICPGNNKHGSYLSNGKGFMINLFKDCDWNNVVVKNTDATGFGMDCPINSTVTNCKAINCGKAAKRSDGGASGFGIGVGYTDNESIVIDNCVSLNNMKFGFFIEHQSRFSPENYKATGRSSYVVKNSIAGGNLYDFGGDKTHYTTFLNVKSITGNGSNHYRDRNLKNSRPPKDPCGYATTIIENNAVKLNNVHNSKRANYAYYTRNSNFVNSNLSDNVYDIRDNKLEIRWALDKGLIDLDDTNKFNNTKVVNRLQAVDYLWRLNDRPGNIEIRHLNNDRIHYKNEMVKIGYADLYKRVNNMSVVDERYQDNYDSIYWAYSNKIISKNNLFYPEMDCSRAQFVTMLYRMVGEPASYGYVPYTDINKEEYYYNAAIWAYNNKIAIGRGNNKFYPDAPITKQEIAILLYRIDHYNGMKHKINYLLDGGSASNKTSYDNRSLPYKLNNPTKEGYSFIGWTGSNGNIPNTNVTIPKNTSETLTYIANFEPSIRSIEVDTMPNKTSYYLGENINITGLTLRLKYGNNNIKIVRDGFTCKPSNLSSIGRQKITVDYKGYQTYFYVNVLPNKIKNLSIISKPNKLDYEVGEMIDTSGLIIEGTFDNNTKGKIKNFKISPNKVLDEGINVITVSYEGRSVTFNVNGIRKENNDNNDQSNENNEEIKPENNDKKTLTSIILKSLPLKTIYHTGEKLDLTGLELCGIYSDGSTEKIEKDYKVSLDENTIFDKIETKTIEVTYQDYKVTFEIEIIAPGAEILNLISKPNKTEYLLYDEFETTGLELEYIDKLGNKNVIISGYTITIENGEKLQNEGPIKVTVSYKNLKVEFQINVYVIKNIKIGSKTKKKYYLDDELKQSDIELIVNYTNGMKKIINKDFDYFVSIGNDFKTKGTKEITVSYKGFQEYYKVKVKSKSNPILIVVLSLIVFAFFVVMVMYIMYKKGFRYKKRKYFK